MKWLLCLFLGVSVATALPTAQKQGKAFSLFSVVTFPNKECTTLMTPAMSGVCVTSEECQNSGNTIATASGNCASGFGVCCFRRIEEAGTVTEDLTHIQSVGFPMAVTALNANPAVDAPALAWNIMTDANCCAVKFDIISAQLSAPAAGVCGDTLNVATPARNPGAGFIPGNLCGVLTGQHLIVDTNRAGGAMAATLTVDTDGNAGDRFWKILVRRIECNSDALPPAGCLQYFTGLSGRITSFNGAQTGDAQSMLQNLNYNICIKRGAGMCGVVYREAGGAIDSFGLGNVATTPENGEITGNTGIDDTCASTGKGVGQYVDIQPVGKICGGVFGPVEGMAKAGPVTSNVFQVGVVSIGGATAMVQPSSGFNLLYSQTPCVNP